MFIRRIEGGNWLSRHEAQISGRTKEVIDLKRQDMDQEMWPEAIISPTMTQCRKSFLHMQRK